MGERTDRTDRADRNSEEIRIEESQVEQAKRRDRGANFPFSFNTFLAELLRLIIYSSIFLLLFFVFFDKFNNQSQLDVINQLDNQNQILGELSVVGSEIRLDEMLVNTSDEVENHFVKIIIVISYESQETGLEINRRMSEIYDRIRKVIGSKKIADIKFIDGQELLSLEIKAEIQKITGKVDIYNIFFRDFAVY